MSRGVARREGLCSCYAHAAQTPVQLLSRKVATRSPIGLCLNPHTSCGSTRWSWGHRVCWTARVRCSN